MRLRAEIRTAIHNIFASKLRAGLAVLGILVGTASVVAMVSGGNLATRQALLQLKALGTDLLAVSVNTMTKGDDQQSKLSLNMALDLQSVSSDILEVAPYGRAFVTPEFEGHELQADVLGVTDGLSRVLNMKMAKGRFIYLMDDYAYYCAIGHDLYQKIRQYDANPVGKQIRLGDNIFTIVGVVDDQEDNMFVYTDVNNTIFIPIKTLALFSNEAPISNIVVRLEPNTDTDNLQDKVKTYFEQHLTNPEVYIRSAKEILVSMQKQKAILTVFLGLIGSISLVVGGIGVMNIMLVSVIERRREIGIRLAVGAKRRDIRILFLIESVTLSLLGGVLGVIVGILISFFIALFKGWEFTLFLMPPVVGFSVSVLVGIFFGYYPAYLASKLDPIETLRVE